MWQRDQLWRKDTDRKLWCWMGQWCSELVVSSYRVGVWTFVGGRKGLFSKFVRCEVGHGSWIWFDFGMTFGVEICRWKLLLELSHIAVDRNATVANYLDFSTVYIMCSLDQFRKTENWSLWFHFWIFCLKQKQIGKEKTYFLHV